MRYLSHLRHLLPTDHPTTTQYSQSVWSLGLPGIVLVSLLNTTSSLAAVQSASPATSSRQSEATQRATTNSLPQSLLALSPAPSLLAQRSTNAKVIFRNDRPSECSVRNGNQERKCQAFQITSTGQALIFSYYFNDKPISFVAFAKPVRQVKSVTEYAAMLPGRNASSDVAATCLVGRKGNRPYDMVMCRPEKGPSFRYFH